MIFSCIAESFQQRKFLENLADSFMLENFIAPRYKQVWPRGNITLNYEQALSFAQRDLQDNWQSYRERYLEGGYS